MKLFPLIAALTLLATPVLAEAPAAAPAPTAEELASPLPPLEVTEADVQAMKAWMDSLAGIADILRTDKTPDTKAAELEKLTEQAQQAGAGMKKLRFWKRPLALWQLGMSDAALQELAQPMMDCAEGGYLGSDRLEKVMNELAEQLLSGPFTGEQGEEDGTILPPAQIVQEYLSIVHGVRVALVAGQDDAARARAMELLTTRLFRLGDMISSDNIKAIRSEIEQRKDDIHAAQQAAGMLIQGLGKDISPELRTAMRDFSEEVAFLEDALMR